MMGRYLSFYELQHRFMKLHCFIAQNFAESSFDEKQSIDLNFSLCKFYLDYFKAPGYYFPLYHYSVFQLNETKKKLLSI